MLAIVLHNLPEGLAVGVSYGGGATGAGYAVTLGILAQNLPEGLAVAAALIADGMPRGRAFLIALASGLVEPLGGLLGVVTVSLSTALLPWGPVLETGARVGCATCHFAVGNRAESNSALVVNVEAPVASANEATGRAPHAVTRRRFFESASLCGTCHEVRTPHLEEPTLSEYRASEFAADDSCASCHLRDGHRVAGLTPKWDGTAEERAVALEASRALLDEALSLEVVGDEVRLTNRGAGHAVPTGMISLRDIWVDVTVFDASGATEVPRVIELGATLERDGQNVALFTDATRVSSRSLYPGETRTWKSPGASRIEARLLARGVRQEVLDALDLPLVAPTLVVR